MSRKRIRLREFDPGHMSMAEPMYWLSKHEVSNQTVGDIFGKTKNHVAVNAYNQSIREQVAFQPPEVPDVALVEQDEDWRDDLRDDELEARVESEAAKFWSNVRGLQGIREFGRLLKEINRPAEENIPRLRLRGRVEHLLAEMYLHNGYLNTALEYCRRAHDTRLKLYNDTRYRSELFAYAKTTLLMTCALEVSGQLSPILPLLKSAEHAFAAAKVPIDPELHRQRGSLYARTRKAAAARKEYEAAYETYPAHRDFLGFQAPEYARFDVGKRALALLDRDHDSAMESLAVAQGWPEGDVHRSTNLNLFIASAFFTDSESEQREALRKLPEAWAAAEGYGRQLTTVRLLELLPEIPKRLQRDWAVYSMIANAYGKL